MSETVSVCVDCLGWLEYGPQDPHWEFSEGYSGPELLEPLAFYVATALCDSEGEPLEPHYSSTPCGGCGSGLAGDRIPMSVALRGESSE